MFAHKRKRRKTTPRTTEIDGTIVNSEEYKEKADNKTHKATINKEFSESKDKRDDIVKNEPKEQTDKLSKTNNEKIITNEDENQPPYDISEPASEEAIEDFKEEFEFEIPGDQEIDKIIVSDGTKAKDKSLLMDEKTKFKGVENEKNFKIEAAIFEKETSKNCEVNKNYKDIGDNKSSLNNDAHDVDDSSSKYCEEDETEFISLEEDELNKLRDLYKSTYRSTITTSNVFAIFEPTESIEDTASKKLKGFCLQQEENFNTTTTKIDETIVNIQENTEKAANMSKTIVDNDKNIKVEDIEIAGHEEENKIILPDNAQAEYLTDDKDKKQLINENTIPEGVKDKYTPNKLKPKTKNKSSDRKRLLRLDNSFIYNEDEEQIDLQHKIKQKRFDAQKQQKVKTYKSTFIQSLATRSQRLGTSAKRFKRSTNAGINAPTQRIRFNDTTAETVTSIEKYTENNDAEDLLQATWIENLENDETQISNDEAKKQRQQPKQEHYLFSSELPNICKPSLSPIPTAKLSERPYEANEKRIPISDEDDDENNGSPSLVSAQVFPKNVDPQLVISDENKDRCVICSKDFIGRLVYHYINEHRGCEIYNSRLSPSQIKLVKQGLCKVSNTRITKGMKYYEAFCIFCQRSLHLIPVYWHHHFSRHTGEFAYRCEGCGLRNTRRQDFRRHQGCSKLSIVQDYFYGLKYFPIKANVCNLCNYVQLHRSNIERHLHTQHNIKEILPEHVETIALLSIPTSMTTSTGSKIDSTLWNKSGAAPSLPSSSHASNTYVINNDDNDNGNAVCKMLNQKETPPHTNPPESNNIFEEFTNFHKATRDLDNSDGSPSFLSSHAEKNQEGIIIGDDNDNENNVNPSLVSALEFPKNVGPQMLINDENKDTCVICNAVLIGRLVHHYVNEHRGCEIYNSRLSPSQIKLVKQGCSEVSNVSLYKNHKYFEAFCVFCQKNLRLITIYWYYHFTRHTGEFSYRCTGCGLRKPIDDFKKHHVQECKEASVAQDYFRSSKAVLPIEANVCTLCNYVQLYRNNIERHLHTQHDIEQILPEHIQTIVLLSKPTSMTAPSTKNKIDSKRWNKSGDALSLPSSSHASNTSVIDNIDNDNTVIFEKIAPLESPPQTNPPTINNNTFEELANCHKATRDLNNSDGSLSLLLRSHADKNQQGLIIGEDDYVENNDNPSLVPELGFPKNIDPQMFVNGKNKYRCVICNKYFDGRLVHHYVNDHRGCEIYNSRLSPSQIKLVKQGRCEVSNVSRYKTHKYYEAFCIFCQKNLRFIPTCWYEHFTRHTGEYGYRCTGCGLRKQRRTDVRNHQAQGCPKARVAQDYFRGSKNVLPIEANVCNLCNYVQMDRSKIERHLHMQHNIEQILPEHIQTIVLLSNPTSMTAPSTKSNIDSRCWNKSGDALSLPSSSHASIDNGDNEKLLPQESQPQTKPPTINNTFEELTNCHKVICSKIMTLADVTAID